MKNSLKKAFWLLLMLLVAVLVYVYTMCTNKTPLTRIPLTLLWVALLAMPIITAILDEIGWWLAAAKHQYAIGKSFIYITHSLVQFPSLMISQSAVPACELSEISLMQGDADAARRWAEIAKAIVVKKRISDFQTWSRLGKIYFELQEYELAHKLLKDAWDMRNEGVSKLERRWQMDPVDDKNILECQDLHLLAELELKSLQVEKAKKHYLQCLKMRRSIPSLSPSASSYEHYIESQIAMSIGDSKTAEEQLLSAANALPKNLKQFGDTDLLFAILQVGYLSSHQSLFEQVYQSNIGLFHPSQRLQLKQSAD